MILFFHGYQSSPNTNKYTMLQGEKHCQLVDYDHLSYQEVSELYDQLITEHQPTHLAGHSLGGYWALIKSHEHAIPCVVANPQCFPDRFYDRGYKDLTTQQITDSVPRVVYMETGDEILRVEDTIQVLMPQCRMDIHHGGHHRLANPSKLDTLVKELRKMDQYEN